MLIAAGFEHIVQEGLVKNLDLQLDEKGNIYVNSNYMTSKPGIFAAGDAKRGASLVVWAIHEGREAASAIDCFLRDNCK